MEIDTILPITEQYITHSEEETILLGENFAKDLNPGDIIALYGELGAGKTQFVKGICNYFNVDQIVNSPTFTIINQYFGSIHDKTGHFHSLNIFHIDLYRIKNLEEIEELGLSECLNSIDSIKIIEWADKIESLTGIISNIPSPVYGEFPITVKISLDNSNENLRFFNISKSK